MKKTNSKKATSWLLTAVFLAFITVFSLFDQPYALAQSEIPLVTTESTSTPTLSPPSLSYLQQYCQ
ncbi:hypothetical protein [Nostoc sp. NZL]|uniref:hypothetical protein n=1 Tax=Nostoc sp. NZL TaxID=2650612 RepID=UPI001E63776B|nr:hypothetical protein [Nostoc sp. NZL]